MRPSRRPDTLGPTGIICPRCRRGEIVPRRVRFQTIYQCSRGPQCTLWMRARPTGRTCPYRREGGAACDALMMDGTSRIPERCSDPRCPNHRPHLLPGRAAGGID